jgi:hypothetical protein
VRSTNREFAAFAVSSVEKKTRRSSVVLKSFREEGSFVEDAHAPAGFGSSVLAAAA